MHVHGKAACRAAVRHGLTQRSKPSPGHKATSCIQERRALPTSSVAMTCGATEPSIKALALARVISVVFVWLAAREVYLGRRSYPFRHPDLKPSSSELTRRIEPEPSAFVDPAHHAGAYDKRGGNTRPRDDMRPSDGMPDRRTLITTVHGLIAIAAVERAPRPEISAGWAPRHEQGHPNQQHRKPVYKPGRCYDHPS